MVVEQHTPDTTETTETRSLTAIRRDLDSLEDGSIDRLTADLAKVRSQAQTKLSGVQPGGEAWKAIVDESEAELDRAERDAVQRLGGIRTRLLADRQQLQDIPYRPSLPADQIVAAEAKATALATRLPGMSAMQVAREVKGAILFNDRPAMAAWAMVAPDIATRFPSTQRVKDADGRDVTPSTLFGSLLRQCEDATADRQVVETRNALETQLTEVSQRISAIATARAAHNPTGGLGGPLLSLSFGLSPEQAWQERRYNPAAVATRIGARV